MHYCLFLYGLQAKNDFYIKKKKLFIWLRQVLVAARGIF